MKLWTWVLMGICLTGVGYAQERAAGSALETQMTWSTLAAQIASVDVKADGLTSNMNKIIQCGQNGLVYGPGGQGAVNACMPAKVDLTAINIAIATLTANLANLSTSVTKVMVCNAKGMVYAPAATVGRDAQDCVSGGGFKVGTITTSVNGSNRFSPNTDYTAAADLFISASSYGGGGQSCPISGYVNGDMVANDYATRYASGIAFMVPKGQKWQVKAAGGNCSNRQASISVLPLN